MVIDVCVICYRRVWPCSPFAVKFVTYLLFGCTHCHPGSQTEVIWHRSMIESPFSVAAAQLEPHRDSVMDSVVTSRRTQQHETNKRVAAGVVMSDEAMRISVAQIRSMRRKNGYTRLKASSRAAARLRAAESAFDTVTAAGPFKQMDAGKVRGAPLVRGAARPAPPAAAPFNSRVRGVEGRGP